MPKEVDKEQTKAPKPQAPIELSDAQIEEAVGGSENRQFTMMSNIMKNRTDTAKNSEAPNTLTESTD